MTPARTRGKDWSYRFEIDWMKSLGFRIDRKSETRVLREHNELVALLYQLRENGQVEVLRQFARGEIPIAILKQAKRAGRLRSDTLLADLALLRQLWHQDARCPKKHDPTAEHSVECLGAVDVILPTMGKGQTLRRHKVSWAKLRRVAGGPKGELPPGALVGDLARADWQSLLDRWPGSPADWNNARRAVSRFLTLLFGHPHHPSRLEIVARIPVAEDEERTPEVTVGEFWDIVDAMPEYARPCYVVLAATGMRLAEYLRCTAEHLVPARFGVRVPGTKTARSRRIVEVGPEAWPWVEAGVPSPLRVGAIHRQWWAACIATGHGRRVQVVDRRGVPQWKTVRVEETDGTVTEERRPVLRYTGLRIHDLRHLMGQWATDEGATTPQVGDALGHADPKTTLRYTRRLSSRAVGRKVTDLLFKGRKAG